jgi:hypothetical protein
MSYPTEPPEQPGNQPGQPPTQPSSQPPYEPGQPPYQSGQPYQGGYQQPYGNSPYGGQPYQGGYPVQPLRPTSSKATVSLILGIVGLVFCGLFLGIPAIIVGRQAKAEIKASQGQLDGGGLATAGIVTGALATAWSLLAVLLVAGIFIFGSTVSTTYQEDCNRTNPDGTVTSC